MDAGEAAEAAAAATAKRARARFVGMAGREREIADWRGERERLEGDGMPG